VDEQRRHQDQHGEDDRDRQRQIEQDRRQRQDQHDQDGQHADRKRDVAALEHRADFGEPRQLEAGGRRSCCGRRGRGRHVAHEGLRTS
jgi:hypothetical protein